MAGKSSAYFPHDERGLEGDVEIDPLADLEIGALGQAGVRRDEDGRVAAGDGEKVRLHAEGDLAIAGGEDFDGARAFAAGTDRGAWLDLPTGDFKAGGGDAVERDVGEFFPERFRAGVPPRRHLRSRE